MSSGGRSYGPEKAPGMGRGQNSVKMKNPAPDPKRGGFDKPIMDSSDAKKIRSMKEKEFRARESGRGKSVI